MIPHQPQPHCHSDKARSAEEESARGFDVDVAFGWRSGFSRAIGHPPQLCHPDRSRSERDGGVEGPCVPNRRYVEADIPVRMLDRYTILIYRIYNLMEGYLQERQSILEEELKVLQRQKSAVEQQVALVSKKLDLIRQMLRLDSGDAEATTPVALGSGADVRSLTRQIIADAGKPLHISEIHRQFMERGYAIPGEGTPFNILAHIVRDKELARVARGTYALASQTPPGARLSSPTPKNIRRRRRKRPA